MILPFFYLAEYNGISDTLTLDENTSRHIIQVLRMNEGERVQLTDGKGNLVTVVISEAHKKHCQVKIEEKVFRERKSPAVGIAISLLKNATRFEWFLEKATEVGVTEIIPLICKRTEKEKFRIDRLQGILVSAMLQSQQSWLPVLHEPVSYDLLFRQEELAGYQNKFIAHCEDGEKKELTMLANGAVSQLILIGPEGDFIAEEVQMAMALGFLPVGLGGTRLRTETAAVVAATLLRFGSSVF